MAEIITSLPSDFMDELGISQQQTEVLIAQINRFNALREKGINNGFSVNEQGKIILPEGTLIHGISNPNPDQMEGIAKTGILTGQAVGVGEDGETFYCADFFRVQQTMIMDEYESQFKDYMGYTPFDKGSRSIAFVIPPNRELDELLSYDCYREGTQESQITRTFVNEQGLPRKGEETATVGSILYGVPSNGVSGIVIGDKLLESQEVVDFAIRLFPGCYIASKKGDVIYDPTKKSINDDELTRLRRERYSLSAQNIALQEKVEREKRYSAQREASQNERYDAFVNSIVQLCDTEQAIAILMATDGKQTSIENVTKLVETIKESIATPSSVPKL